MIECEGLTKRFGTFTAVDHVSFSVGKGSIFGFLGPNGSGKSTVIRMLCGILEPTEGTARIGGHDIITEGDEIKEMIGYMSQKFSLYDELTTNENLLFAGKLYGLKRRIWRNVATNSSRSRISSPISIGARLFFLVAGVNGWPWPARSCINQPFCSSTSPRPASIRWRGANCGTSSSSSPDME